MKDLDTLLDIEERATKDSEDHNIGVNLIALLGLKLKSNGRVDTKWGDKTPKGLARTVRSIMGGEEA
jgi:hypothetical protein